MADIDECSLGSHLCDQTCANVVGSYVCSCETGYRLNSDEFNCSGELHKFNSAIFQSLFHQNVYITILLLPDFVVKVISHCIKMYVCL